MLSVNEITKMIDYKEMRNFGKSIIMTQLQFNDLIKDQRIIKEFRRSADKLGLGRFRLMNVKPIDNCRFIGSYHDENNKHIELWVLNN